jgi:hypothetical protein
LKTAFSSLKKLELRIDTLRKDKPFNCRGISYFGFLPQGLQSMQNVVDISMSLPNDRPHPNGVIDLFQVMLQRSYSPHGPESCHVLETTDTDVSDTRNSTIWLPSNDLSNGTAGDDWTTMPTTTRPPAALLRILNPNPWPRLVKLSLSRIRATKFDLASLFITVSNSLRSLQLYNVRIGKCGCADRPIGGALQWTELYDWQSQGKDHWYDTMIMMSNVLQLQSCRVVLIPEDLSLLLKQLKNFAGFPDTLADRVTTRPALLGEYVVQARGDGLARWLVSKFDSEGSHAAEDKTVNSSVSGSRKRKAADMDVE